MDPITKEILKREEESNKLNPKSSELNKRLRRLSDGLGRLLAMPEDLKENELKKVQSP
jgi:hypothetical protein